MLLAGGSGPTLVEPTTTPTPVAEEVIATEAAEMITSTEVEATPTPEPAMSDFNNPSWIVLLIFVLALFGIAIYQVFKSKNDGKTVAKKGK